jgi:hypothetical protein
MGTGFAAGATPAPGSDQDPLVTKSYVDQEIAKLADNLPEDTASGAVSMTLEVVVVPAGQKLIGQGGAEFILRSGKGKIIGSAAGGIPDLTAGGDLKSGEAIPLNHLLLLPKSDERGLLATTQIIVMVRGSYEVKE